VTLFILFLSGVEMDFDKATKEHALKRHRMYRMCILATNPIKFFPGNVADHPSHEFGLVDLLVATKGYVRTATEIVKVATWM